MFMAHIFYKYMRSMNTQVFTWRDAITTAWYFIRLREAFCNGIVTFSYWKKDLTIREARGTLSLDLIPTDKQPKGLDTKRKPNYSIFNYFDLEKGDWRAFDIRDFIGFVTVYRLTKTTGHSLNNLQPKQRLGTKKERTKERNA